MKTLIVFILLACCFINLIGQEISQQFKIYKTTVCIKNDKSKIKGVFYALKDSSIFISDSYHKKDYYSGNYKVSQILIKDIKKLKIRRKGKVGRSAVFLGATGAVFGGILGYSSGEWESEEQYHPDSQAYFFGTVFCLFGATIGTIIGIPSHRYRIDGNFKYYSKYEKKFKKYSIIKE